MKTLIPAAIVMLLAASGSAQTNPPAPAPTDRPVVVTTGEGVVKRAPDRAWVAIAAESRARNPREAQRANAEAMTSVMQKLKSAGVAGDAIKTTGYNVQPEYDYNNGRQTLRGYVARNSIEVRVDDLNRAGDILDVAVGSGATSVGAIRFDLKEREAAEREALRLAVADARARAEAAVQGAGMRIESVIRIEEARASFPEPRQMRVTEMAMVRSEASPTPIEAGDIEIRASVTLTALIR